MEQMECGCNELVVCRRHEYEALKAMKKHTAKEIFDDIESTPEFKFGLMIPSHKYEEWKARHVTR